jgi:cation transport regulator ChaB
MPKGQHELPDTLKRSPKKAQRTWRKALESAEEEYGEDSDRAFRTAYAALKHSFEKVGDHWEPKDEKGPSDPAAEARGSSASRRRETYGGVDAVGNTKQELYERAKALDVPGRSSMSKAELAKAIARKQD